MRVVFMGSSAASATCLQGLLRIPELEVAGVVTQPDRPAGRGKALTPCPCKTFAMSRGITSIISPENVNSPEAMAAIAAWRPDVVAVVAFGQFLKKPLLDLPRHGCINCHFSLLPKYRGASPVATAMAAGERMTGVTIMRMGLGMDSGPVLMQAYEPVYSDSTGGSMMEELAVAGGVTLAKALTLMARGTPPAEIPQNDSDATFAPKLKKTDGQIDWNEPVLAIERKIRAYLPWPGCYAFLPERFRRKSSGRITVLRAKIVNFLEESWRSAAPGTILAAVSTRARDSAKSETGPVVKCGDTALMLTMLKPEGGQAMDGASFLRGRPLVPFADSLSAPPAMA